MRAPASIKTYAADAAAFDQQFLLAAEIGRDRGLDSGTVAAAQSVMPSIAARSRTNYKQRFHRRRRIYGASAPVSNLHQLDGRDQDRSFRRVRGLRLSVLVRGYCFVEPEPSVMHVVPNSRARKRQPSLRWSVLLFLCCATRARGATTSNDVSRSWILTDAPSAVTLASQTHW
jgi:hypothetical protein